MSKGIPQNHDPCLSLSDVYSIKFKCEGRIQILQEGLIHWAYDFLDA